MEDRGSPPRTGDALEALFPFSGAEAADSRGQHQCGSDVAST
jgi:hypothetical protein